MDEIKFREPDRYSRSDWENWVCKPDDTLTTEKFATLKKYLKSTGPIALWHFHLAEARSPTPVVFTQWSDLVCYMSKHVKPGDAADAFPFPGLDDPQILFSAEDRSAIEQREEINGFFAAFHSPAKSEMAPLLLAFDGAEDVCEYLDKKLNFGDEFKLWDFPAHWECEAIVRGKAPNPDGRVPARGSY